MAVKAKTAKGTAKGKAAKPKRVAWSQARERRFLTTLAETCNVRASCDAAGVSNQAIYRRRQKTPGFRAAWEQALEEGFARLKLMMLERALRVTPVVVEDEDGEPVKVPPASDAIRLQLMRQHSATVRRAEHGPELEDIAVVRKRIADTLAEMNRRLTGGDEAAG